VHKASVTACVRIWCERQLEEQIAEFSTTVHGLLALRDWLEALGVTQVAMEATGVYWRPVWAVLEDNFELMLVNARHVKQCPGRKTDVLDAQWLCQLLEAGLLKPSFVPPKPIRTLRNLTRYRKPQIADRQREAARLHKLLEDTGIKLGCVASDILGKSGRDMLDALVAGTTDPAILADLSRGVLRKKIPALREALEGRFDSEHTLIVGQILAHIDFLDEAINRLSVEIEERIRPFAAQRDLLMRIPGVKQRTAEVLIAEIGVDMTTFPTPKHLASWAGVCPGQNESGGKKRSGKTRKGLQMAPSDVDRSRTRRHQDQGLLPRRPIPAAPRAARPLQSRHRGRPLDPHRRMAHAHQRRALHRPRWRLLHPSGPRPGHTTARAPTPSARPRRDHPTPGRCYLTGFRYRTTACCSVPGAGPLEEPAKPATRIIRYAERASPSTLARCRLVRRGAVYVGGGVHTSGKRPNLRPAFRAHDLICEGVGGVM